METWKDYINRKKMQWVGKKVKYEGVPYTVIGVDYNGGLLIDKKGRFTDDTSVEAFDVEVIE